MNDARRVIDPHDLTWDAPANDERAESSHDVDEVLQTLTRTRVRCRAISDYARARASAPTLPALSSVRRGEVPSGFRPPEPGAVEVVAIRPSVSPPPQPRRATRR